VGTPRENGSTPLEAETGEKTGEADGVGKRVRRKDG